MGQNQGGLVTHVYPLIRRDDNQIHTCCYLMCFCVPVVYGYVAIPILSRNPPTPRVGIKASLRSHRGNHGRVVSRYMSGSPTPPTPGVVFFLGQSLCDFFLMWGGWGGGPLFAQPANQLEVDDVLQILMTLYCFLLILITFFEMLMTCCKS